jgi:hypothetical protein
MKRSLIALFALTLIYSSLSPLAAQDPITIRVYNFAGTAAAEIARAEQEADEIFARANVRLSWLDCTYADGKPADSTCNAISGPAVLNLRLLPAQMEPKQGLQEGIFGFSMMSTTGGFSATANVYVDRISAIADGRKYRQPVVMGAVIAHELGHLMLGIGSHSKAGLMSLPWGPDALTAADQGTLSFSKKEARQLEKAAEKRTTTVTRAGL